VDGGRPQVRICESSTRRLGGWVPPSTITRGSPSAIRLKAASNVVMSAVLSEPAAGPGSPNSVRPGPSAVLLRFRRPISLTSFTITLRAWPHASSPYGSVVFVCLQRIGARFGTCWQRGSCGKTRLVDLTNPGAGDRRERLIGVLLVGIASRLTKT
jgi:hypothetical protein